MSKTMTKALFFMLGFVSATLIGGAALLWHMLGYMNTIIIHDDHKVIVDASFEYSDRATPLSVELDRDIWVGSPEGDGLLRAKCHDGTEAEFGYITTNFRTEYVVDQNCEVIASIRGTF